MHRSRPVIVLAALASAFFFLPAVVYVGGVRGRPIENRRAAAFPDLGHERFDSFGPITQWALDRLPLRPDAVKARARLTRRFFGELPTITVPSGPAGPGQLGRLTTTGKPSTDAALARASQVLLGRKGWLFLGEEFVLACEPEQPRAAVIAGVERLAALLRAGGRRLVLAVAPDKSTLSRAFWPSDLPERACAEREKRRRLAELRALPDDVGVVDLAAALARQQAKTGPIYAPEDTHWSQLGATVYARTVMRRLQPSLLRRTRFVHTGSARSSGDLAEKAGDPHERRQPRYVLRRARVTTRKAGLRELRPGYAIERFRSSTRPGGALLYQPRTVFYGDSFTDVSIDKLLPFFRDVTRIPELGRAALGNYQPAADAAFVAAVRESRMVVVEVAERIFWGRKPGSVVDPALLGRLERALRERR